MMSHSGSSIRGWTLLLTAAAFAAPAAAAPMQVDPFQSTVVAEPLTGTEADLEDEVTVTVTVRNGAGQPLPGRIVRVDSTQLADLIAQPTGPTNAGGVAIATLVSDVAGSRTITATVDPSGAAILLDDAPVVQMIEPIVHPNVLIVLLDDVGTDALSLWAPINPYRTDLPYVPEDIGEGDGDLPTNGQGTSNLYVSAPTLEQLANDGVTFMNAYAMPLCSPTRATLLTGQYPVRHGIGHVVRFDNLGGTLDEFGDPGFEFDTLAHIAQEVSYKDAIFGKWHLGTQDSAMMPQEGQPYYLAWETIPVRGGFTYWHAVFNNVDTQPVPPPAGTFYNFFYNRNRTEHSQVVADGPITQFATTVQFDDARTWCNAQDDPFVCLVTPTAAHSPWDDLPPANLVETLEYFSPPLNAWTGQLAQIEALDAKIGDLWNGLDPEVRAITTLIVLGDNGTPDVVLEHARLVGPILDTSGSGKDLGETYDFLLDNDRFKSSVYEKGSRVPLIVAGYGITSPGRVSDALVDVSDIHPTVAEIIGAAEPRSTHGISMMPILQDEVTYETHARDFTYTELFSPLGSTGPGVDFSTRMVGCSFVIPGQGRYKIVYDESKASDEFYKLQDASGNFVDPFETVPLAHGPGSLEHPNYLLVLAKMQEIIASGDDTGPTSCHSDVNFCSSQPNSTGFPATIHVENSCSIALNDLTLVAQPVPDQFGIFFYSLGMVNGGNGIPFGNGLRCVGGGGNPQYRLPITLPVGGVLSYTLDYDSTPTGGDIEVASTWHFQGWFRDPAGGGELFDLSDAVTVTFGP